jgi:hypothetical protein
VMRLRSGNWASISMASAFLEQVDDSARSVTELDERLSRDASG